MPKSTAGKLQKQDSSLTFQQHETDSPFLPIPHLEKLNKLNPSHVDWYLRQTGIEADHRRIETSKGNTRAFYFGMFGQISAFVLGMAGLLIGSYTALNGQPAAGATIASVTIGTLAVGFIAVKRADK